MREVSGAPNCMGELVTFHPLGQGENKREKKRREEMQFFGMNPGRENKTRIQERGYFFFFLQVRKNCGIRRRKMFSLSANARGKKGKTIEEMKKNLLFSMLEEERSLPRK